MQRFPRISEGGSLKYRIRDFAIKYGQQLNLYRAKMAKSLEEKVSQGVEGGFSSHRYSKADLECDASECYKGFVVRSKPKRISNKAMKCNVFTREEVHSFKYIEFIKSPDEHVLGLNS